MIVNVYVHFTFNQNIPKNASKHRFCSMQSYIGSRVNACIHIHTDKHSKQEAHKCMCAEMKAARMYTYAKTAYAVCLSLHTQQRLSLQHARWTLTYISNCEQYTCAEVHTHRHMFMRMGQLAAKDTHIHKYIPEFTHTHAYMNVHYSSESFSLRFSKCVYVC
jgi:hypothetical protein